MGVARPNAPILGEMGCRSLELEPDASGAVKQLARVSFLLIAVVAVLRITTLGAYPLLDPTEGRYAEIPREMLAANDWVSPRLDPETPFLAKPPLSFWVTALVYRGVGISEFSARLSSFLFAALMAFFTGLLGTSLYGRAGGLVSAAILVTGLLFFPISGTVLTDPSLGAAVTLALVGVPMAIRAPSLRARRLWGYSVFLGLGLSALAKGLIGPVLCLGTVFLWGATAAPQRRLLRCLPWVGGCLVALTILVPWHILAEIRTPGFLEYYLLGEHFQRFLVPSWPGDRYGHAHTSPHGAIWLYFLLASLPWSLLLMTILRRRPRRQVAAGVLSRDPWSLYLLIWLLFPMVFFTMARSVVVTYVLPVLPAFALLTARTFLSVSSHPRWEDARWLVSPRSMFLVGLSFPLLFFVCAALIMPLVGTHYSQKALVERFHELDPEGKAVLVYAGHMPYSADFYSGGRAKKIPVESARQILDEIDDSDLDFFAIDDDALRQFPRAALEQTVVVGTFGELVLRKEIHPTLSLLRSRSQHVPGDQPRKRW
jgi:4-amino-4-deoxy-L-arabinose transferase-like glycosyltransferase